MVIPYYRREPKRVDGSLQLEKVLLFMLYLVAEGPDKGIVSCIGDQDGREDPQSKQCPTRGFFNFRDGNENIFISVSCFKTRTGTFPFNPGL